MNPIKHFIITRFNVAFKKGPDVTGKSKAGLAWLNRRFELFHKYYVPSIKNQWNKNFEIIFVCDPQSSPTTLQELGNFGTTITCSIKDWFSSIKTPAITSRLDSDDALHMCYTEYVQQYFSDKQENCLADIIPAFYIEETGRTGTFQKSYPTQFISMLSIDNKANCYSREHGAMKKVCSNYHVINHFYGALHVIHGTNLTDKKRMFPNFKDIDLTDYGLKI